MRRDEKIGWAFEAKSAWKQRNDVLEYIEQCMDIIEAKAEKAEGDWA